MQCDFGSSLCSYTQDTSDDLDWIDKLGAADFFGDKGPERDHTSSKGE